MFQIRSPSNIYLLKLSVKINSNINIYKKLVATQFLEAGSRRHITAELQRPPKTTVQSSGHFVCVGPAHALCHQFQDHDSRSILGGHPNLGEWETPNRVTDREGAKSKQPCRQSRLGI